LLTCRDKCEQKERLISSLELSLSQLEKTLESLQSEFGTDLYAGLTDEERQALKTLNERLSGLQSALTKASDIRTELEVQKNQLENLLNENLVKRQQELEAKGETLESESDKQQFKEVTTALDAIQNSIKEITDRQQVVEEQLEKMEQRKTQLRKDIEKLKSAELNSEKALQDESKKMEKLLNKRSLLLQRKDDCMRKIREIGSLPSATFEDFKELPSRELMQRLHKTNGELKKFSNVNKKALGQYMHFSEQKEELLKRWDEIVEGEKAINELIETLDKRKDEAILLTFRGVAKRFAQVFQVLAKNKGGEASLAMVKQRPTEEEVAPTVNAYTGVGFTVSFGGVECRREQLSAGQECLVALALIFAIHKCDPAPFYIFDEIDPNLDEENRAALASMVKEITEEFKTQFITVTHHTELCKTSDKCFKIEYKYRLSIISAFSKEEASEFVSEIEGKGGEEGEGGD